MADLRRTRRRRWLIDGGRRAAAPVCSSQPCGPTSMPARGRGTSRRRSPRRTAQLAALRHDVAIDPIREGRHHRTNATSLQTSIASTMSQLAATNGSLANTNVHDLRAGGRHRHAADLPGRREERVRSDRRQGQRPGRQGHLGGLGRVHPAGGRHEHRPGLPVRLPGPCRHPGGARPTTPTPPTPWRGTSRSSIRPTSPTGRAVGNALPSLPAWAAPNYTWAPLGRHARRELRPLLRGRRGGQRAGVHLGSDRQPTAGAVHRHVDGAAGVPEVAGGLHRPCALHRHQRDAVPGVEVRWSGLVEDLVGATRLRPARRSSPGQPASLLVPDQSVGGRDRRGARTGRRRAVATTSSIRATTGTARTTPSASPPAPARSGRAVT